MPLESGTRCAAVDNIGDDWHNPMLQNRGFVTEATAPAQFHIDELMEEVRPAVGDYSVGTVTQFVIEAENTGRSPSGSAFSCYASAATPIGSGLVS
jgi:hypothetical protein